MQKVQEKKTIAFIISSLNSGGAERVVSLLANEFSKNKEVLIITLNKDKPFYKLDPNVKLFQLGVLNSSNYLFAALFSNLILILKILKIVLNHKVTHVIGFMTTSNILAIICGKFILNRKVTISERVNPETYDFGIWSKITKYLYKYSDYLVVQTDFIKEYYSKIMPVSKIRIINNPIKLINSEFNIKEKIVLTVGRMDQNKNQEQVIRSFAKINPQDWRLIVCGDGVLMDRLKNLADSLRISSKVVFTGSVKNIEDYYSRASVFAFSSFSEGFPNVLLEAMNYGCACISTNCPTGPSELIVHEVNGYLTDIGDYGSYDIYLEKLIKEKFTRADFVIKSKNVLRNYSINKVASQWVD